MSIELIENTLLLQVEGDIEIRGIYERFLKSRIKNVITCSNGKESYVLCKNYNPDIIVIDIKMPIMSGLEISSMIRDNNNDIPIIVITAH